MATAPSTPSPTAATVLLPRFADAELTYNRPLSAAENGFLSQRGVHGGLDLFTILKIDCPAGINITDDRLTWALTVLRLRNPLIASKVSYASPTPHVVYAHPLTEVHAAREAGACLEFATFNDIDSAVKALHDRLAGVDPHYTLDVRNSLISVVWSKGVGPAAGKYILGMQCPHFILDGRRLLSLVRQFIELLADSGRAQAELARRFNSPVKLPESLESFVPDLSTCSADEVEKGKAAYEDVMKWSSQSLSGLRPDGSLQGTKVSPRLLRHTWSQSDTSAILRACKSQAVTITQLILASMAIAAVPSDRNDAGTSVALGDTSSPSDEADDSYYFHITLPVDLGTRIQKPADNDEGSALIISTYPVFIRIPKSIRPNAPDMAAIWPVAQECKERSKTWIESPYFWHLNSRYMMYVYGTMFDLAAGKPALPSCSSLGDCTKLLPSRYPVASSENGTDASSEGTGGEIRIADMVVGGKPNGMNMVINMWTFDGRFNLQLRHNSLRMSDALVDSYFSCIIDVVTRAGA